MTGPIRGIGFPEGCDPAEFGKELQVALQPDKPYTKNLIECLNEAVSTMARMVKAGDGSFIGAELYDEMEKFSKFMLSRMVKK